jgi:tRNA-specific 2-thiouridylase
MKKERVFVGMSGGVDSSVAALLLKEAGFDVTGVFIRGWYPDFLECTWKEDERDAMRVAASLGIPFFTIDAEEAYKKHVVDYIVREYSRGRTPNPDIMCNRYVKFGVFFDEAMARGADCIATGHYARVKNTNGRVVLAAGVDTEKDQSYFLWNVSRDTLAKTLFPLGEMKKQDVRALARRRGLITADKKDSQGICFLGNVSMKGFLAHSIPPKRGDVLNVSGETIGFHDGAFLFTIGERRGFTITKKGTSDAPRFVIAKDIAANTITVSERMSQEYKNAARSEVVIEDTNWIFDEPKENEKLSVRFRHGQPLQHATLQKTSSELWHVSFAEPQEAIASGQSLVVYRGDECLGGGICLVY